MKKLLMLGLLMGAFYAGTLYDQQVLHLKEHPHRMGRHSSRRSPHRPRGLEHLWDTLGPPAQGADAPDQMTPFHAHVPPAPVTTWDARSLLLTLYRPP